VPKKTQPPSPAPLPFPLTESEWFAQTCATMLSPDASPEARAEYQRLLRLRPDTSKAGDLAWRAQQAALAPYKALPMLQADVTHRLKLMRAELAGASPSPLELLIIDVILCSYQDHFESQTLYRQQQAKGLSLHALEQWERILTQKEARYLRAIATLARVRRLLKLPGAQVNINLPGGQQVNMQGAAEL
jgi:hypothetical protein